MAAAGAARAVGVDLINRAEAAAKLRAPGDGSIVGGGVVTGVVGAVGVTQAPDVPVGTQGPGVAALDPVVDSVVGCHVGVRAARDLMLLGVVDARTEQVVAVSLAVCVCTAAAAELVTTRCIFICVHALFVTRLINKLVDGQPPTTIWPTIAAHIRKPI